MVPITFRFIIPLTWCHRRSITPSWNISRIVSWPSSTFWALPGYQLNSWWEIPSFPLMICVIIDNILDFPLNTNLFVFCVIPWDPCYPTFVLLYLGSITIFYVKDVVRTAPPLKEFLVLWYFSPSPFFLGPRVDSNRDTNTWTMLLRLCTSSNPIALKLMVNISFLDHWLSNYHSNIDPAT